MFCLILSVPTSMTNSLLFFMQITYGDPNVRFYLLKEQEIWNINLHVIGINQLWTFHLVVHSNHSTLIFYADRIEKPSGKPIWDLMKPVPLGEDGNFDSYNILGKNAEVHYIYVCTKVSQSISLESKPWEIVDCHCLFWEKVSN